MDKNQKNVRIIKSHDVILNGPEMPCKENEEQQEIVREESPIEVECVNIHIPNTMCEVKNDTQNQKTLKGDVVM